MSRKIKFRGKRKSFNKWMYFDFNKINSDNQPSDFFQYHLDTDTIGQFTGLKDFKGSEIYEGDILKITLYDDDWITNVRYYSGTLVIDVEHCDLSTTALSFLDEDAEVEIIGNIHENPELLTK